MLAGIDGSALVRSAEPFGAALQRVSLHEGIADEGLRAYVTAQLELADAPRDLRAAFDDAALAELGRKSAGNPRRLHIAAQQIAQRLQRQAPVSAFMVEPPPPEPEPQPQPVPEPVQVTPPPPPPVATLRSRSRA